MFVQQISKMMVTDRHLFSISGMLLRLLIFTLASAPRPSSALSYGPSFLQEPPPTVLYSNNTGLVLGSGFHGQTLGVFYFFNLCRLFDHLKCTQHGGKENFVHMKRVSLLPRDIRVLVQTLLI